MLHGLPQSSSKGTRDAEPVGGASEEWPRRQELTQDFSARVQLFLTTWKNTGEAMP